MTKLVDFETAKLLKNKRFNFYCNYSYWEGELTPHTVGYPLEDGTTSQENYWDFERYYAPTIAQVVMWLYEKHQFWIQVEYYHYSKHPTPMFYWNCINTDSFELYDDAHIGCSTPSEAYQEAIKYILNNLI